MKSIFQLIFLISFYIFGILNALQIHDSADVASVDGSVLGNEVFDLGSKTETSFETDSQEGSKSVDTQREKSSTTKTTRDTYTTENYKPDTYTKTGESYDESDAFETESTRTQDLGTYQTNDENTSSNIGETKTTTVKGSYQTLGTKSTVKTNKGSRETQKFMKMNQTSPSTTSQETSDDFGTEDYTNEDSTYSVSENESTSQSQSTSATPTETETGTETETKHIGFDGDGFLKAVSKLVNIRKRIGTGNTSVTTTKDYQKGATGDYSESTSKPNNQDKDDDDDDDQDSFFKKYGIPEYVVWIIIYTVPIVIILLFCLTSYCCCCRR
ncbi:uncharacterized protein cubi_03161 [Cryptosporidium ubiquitum]|uniref:Uncharacterized protein n=1 Tax=Cryptosporidium ubiquitum TaxID=857276 RepID=A0A1J4MNL6_9CRYT|nr:uncharacterized protein cubi_03161 [Cryptosporidium ubiquitum]OII75051.1 hypothetical protein cubi_03161 [Cryptosporidium ubiquitum]